MANVLSLYDYQKDAVKKMKNGCILCGGVGSGKSRTALAYYYCLEGGKVDTEDYYRMKSNPKDLYIITTARKRDTLEWEGELSPFLLSTKKESNSYNNTVIVDSWNNIKKYKNVDNAFFIFDEQRIVGYGAWVKAFLRIAKNNEWILLSATPGDTWSDYIPVFIANGFYQNKTEFVREHVVYSPFTKYPKIQKYLNLKRLNQQRDSILIHMDYKRTIQSHHEDMYCDYDALRYKEIIKNRWDDFNNKPIENAVEFCYILRRVVNEDVSRQILLLEIMEKHPKAIIFYNFNYELKLLKELLNNTGIEVAEWNGHIHQPVPEENSWAYLVQYNAGSEGWNCITTDTIIFYSENYSYKMMVQAAGRIDRVITPFRDLYYYHLKSRSGIDMAISRTLQAKKEFNCKVFAGKVNFIGVNSNIDDNEKMYKSYLDIQERNAIDVILLRIGDFYEIIGEKSKQISELLNIMPTSRNCGIYGVINTCGFPVHCLERYLDNILNHYSVIIVDNQTNDELKEIKVLSREEYNSKIKIQK